MYFSQFNTSPKKPRQFVSIAEIKQEPFDWKLQETFVERETQNQIPQKHIKKTLPIYYQHHAPLIVWTLGCGSRNSRAIYSSQCGENPPL